MDSLSQLALGAAIGVAVMGRRTAVWKAALWGGVCGTLPDLDAFLDHGDAVRNMTLHRAQSHALFFLSLAAPFIAWLIAALHRERAHFGRWWLAVWLALITHPLLDLMTVYGTQIARPFTDHPYGVGSIFIIDPLYTLPLLVGVIAALAWRSPRGRRWNAVGLVLSTAYLGWSVLAQQHVRGIALASLRDQGLPAQQVLVTPTPFNTVLWRVVSMAPDGYHEGFVSLLDTTEPGRPRVDFDRFDSAVGWLPALQAHEPVARLTRFTHGFYKLDERDGRVRITDLRMGQEPTYTFTFAVAERQGDRLRLTPPSMEGGRPDVGAALRWLSRRIAGERLAPPR